MLYRKNIKDKDIDMIRCKPPFALWFSKGEWLFHEIGCYKNSRITLVEINYDNIYRITNKIPNNLILDTYYKKNLSLFIKNNKVISDEMLFSKKKIILINWKNIIKNYSGFAIYPFPLFIDIKNNTWLHTMDVSSLALWNTNSIINSYDLGKVSKYINIDKFNKNDKIIITHTRFIKNLVNQINQINQEN